VCRRWSGRYELETTDSLPDLVMIRHDLPDPAAGGSHALSPPPIAGNLSQDFIAVAAVDHRIFSDFDKL